MSKFLVRCFVFALALMATSYLLGSVEVTGFVAAFIAAIIFAGFNTLVLCWYKVGPLNVKIEFTVVYFGNFITKYATLDSKVVDLYGSLYIPKSTATHLNVAPGIDNDS